MDNLLMIGTILLASVVIIYLLADIINGDI